MANIVKHNKYILEIETEACILISVYEKSREGLENAFLKIESFLGQRNYISAKITYSDTEEEVWSSLRAS